MGNEWEVFLNINEKFSLIFDDVLGLETYLSMWWIRMHKHSMDIGEACTYDLSSVSTYEAYTVGFSKLVLGFPLMWYIGVFMVG